MISWPPRTVQSIIWMRGFPFCRHAAESQAPSAVTQEGGKCTGNMALEAAGQKSIGLGDHAGVHPDKPSIIINIIVVIIVAVIIIVVINIIIMIAIITTTTVIITCCSCRGKRTGAARKILAAIASCSLELPSPVNQWGTLTDDDEQPHHHHRHHQQQHDKCHHPDRRPIRSYGSRANTSNLSGTGGGRRRWWCCWCWCWW